MSSLMDLYNARRRPAGREQGGEQELDEEDFGDDEEAAEQYRLEREEREKARADARARAQVPQGGLWQSWLAAVLPEDWHPVLPARAAYHVASAAVEISIDAGASCLVTKLPMLVLIAYCTALHCLCQETDTDTGALLPSGQRLQVPAHPAWTGCCMPHERSRSRTLVADVILTAP